MKLTADTTRTYNGRCYQSYRCDITSDVRLFGNPKTYHGNYNAYQRPVDDRRAEAIYNLVGAHGQEIAFENRHVEKDEADGLYHYRINYTVYVE